MKETLGTIEKQEGDFVLIMELGPAGGVPMKVRSLGKEYRVVERHPVMVGGGCRRRASAPVAAKTPGPLAIYNYWKHKDLPTKA